MATPSRVTSAALAGVAIIGSACAPAEPQRVLTVEELDARVDELNGTTVSVAGYLAWCGGYDCTLYRNKQDSDDWDRFMAAVAANHRPSLPQHPTIGIGSGPNLSFDRTAEPFMYSYVVITGRVTNRCRFEGMRSCTDRSPDLNPTGIRAGGPPA
jgi:hypothetical protein